VIRGRRLVPVVALTFTIASCAGADGERQPTAGTQSDQRRPLPPAPPAAPVTLPDLSMLAAPVQHQLREAYAQLTATVAKEGASADRAESYATLGRILMAARFGVEAANCFVHAQALAPGDARWPYYLGQAYLRTGDRPRAITEFARVVALQPDNLVARVWLAETYLDDGQLETARASFQAALGVQPQSAAALFGAGRTALALGSYSEAVEMMEKALLADPRASAVHYPLATAYRAINDPGNAEAHLRQRGNTFPDLVDPLMREVDTVLESPIALEGAGLDALRSGDLAGATATFRRGLALQPDDVSLRYWLGAALYASGNTADAEREFAAVVRQSPDYAKAHFSLGAIADANGRTAAAIERYRAAVRADPTLPDARLRLAADLQRIGQMDSALGQYDAVTKLDPGVAEAWIGGGQCLLALGRTEPARDWLARALRLHPTRPELVQLQARLASPGR
jgi:tetratricopeptide (TPR) repeat protein